MTMEIRGPVQLPARREEIELHTLDGLTLVGELALPEKGAREISALYGLPFDGGAAEEFDVAAAMAFVHDRGLPHPWILGWSFGTELALKYGRDHAIEGAILLSPPLHRATADDVAAWSDDPRRLVVVVPEFDDYLRPAEARERFASVPGATLIAVDGGKHLWVGETQTRRVLTEIVAATNPDALPLPTEWDA